MSLWKRAGCETESKAFEKSIVKRIIRDPSLGKGSVRGDWDPREDQQRLRPNPNGVEDRITTLRRLLIGAETLFICQLSKSFLQNV